jgi:hypothetical protein
MDTLEHCKRMAAARRGGIRRVSFEDGRHG